MALLSALRARVLNSANCDDVHHPLFAHTSVNCDDALRVQVTAAVSAVLVSVALANSSPAAQAPCTSTPANQNAALKALYDSTNGPNWAVVPNKFGLDGSPWTAGDACATRFRGVYCAGRPGTSVCDVVYVLTLLFAQVLEVEVAARA